MPLAPERETRSYDDTVKRTGADYIKFTTDYRTVFRILQPEVRSVWKHYIPQANQGRGSGAVCPNVAPGMNICPLEQSVASLPKDSQERKDATARMRFIINVLDRTPHTTCPACNTLTPGKTSAAASGKQCVNCGSNLKGADFAPLNKVKVLEQGPNLFRKQLNVIEKMQEEELGVPITAYDITVTAQGIGRDRTLTAMPQDPKEITDEEMLDPETGEPQKLWDLELLAEPESTEVITLMMQGASFEQIAAVKGVSA